MWAEVKSRAQDHGAGSVDWKSSLLPKQEQERGLSMLVNDVGTAEGRDHRMLMAFQPCFPQDQRTMRHTIICILFTFSTEQRVPIQNNAMARLIHLKHLGEVTITNLLSK